MKTGVYQTNISHPGKATAGGWDVLFADGIFMEEALEAAQEHWQVWLVDYEMQRAVFIRPVGVKQLWTDNRDGTFTLIGGVPEIVVEEGGPDD